MGGASVQFRGVENVQLLSLLAAAITAALLGYGLWRLIVRKQRRSGIAALAAGALAAALLTATAVCVDPVAAAGKGIWMLTTGVIVAAAVGVFYSTVYAYLGPKRLGALMALRVLAILALLLVLFKPAISIPPSADAHKPALTILLDRSASMDTIDNADMPSRYGQAVDALRAQQGRLEEHFRVGWLHFAADTRQTDGPDELAELTLTGEDGKTTDIAGAIHHAAGAYSVDESAAVILISDGLHNAPGDPAAAAGESLTPVHVIGIGSTSEGAARRRNVALISVDAPLEAAKDDVTKLTAHVRLTGWANLSARVVLRTEGKEIASQQVSAEGNSQELPVQLNWTASGEAPADGPDIRKLTIAIEPNPAEATADDNTAEVHVLVTRPAIRVLYIEGARPEYKFLRRALASDPNIKLISLARYAQGRLLSQGSIDGRRLTDLPRKAEDFGFFDVIILGDLDRTFLTNEQMDLISRFVNDGKALLMLGGRNSFGPGGYGGTAIEAALPVLCGGRSQPQETTPFVPQLTADGGASPIFAGITKYFGSPAGDAAEPVPELLGCVTVLRAKPAATVLAIHPTRRNASGPLVVLATHQYGSGRAAAFTADTTWKWYLRTRAMGVESPHHRFWGQLVRYLAGVDSDAKRSGASVLARIDRHYLRQGEELKITAQVKGDDGRAAENANVSAELKSSPTAEPVRIPLSPVGGGMYEAAHKPADAGACALTVSATDSAGKPLGADELPLTVAKRAKETDRLARDAASLKAIAAAAKGRYAELAELPEVIDQVIARQAGRIMPAPKPTEYDLHNFPILFFVFVGLLTAEWLIRRNWQLQ